MIRRVLARLTSTTGPDDPRALRAEIDRLQTQNEKLRTAMRQCVDCEYRIEVLANRAEAGQPAAGPAARQPPESDA